MAADERGWVVALGAFFLRREEWVCAGSVIVHPPPREPSEGRTPSDRMKVKSGAAGETGSLRPIGEDEDGEA